MNKYKEYSKIKEARNKLYSRIHGKNVVNGCLRKVKFASKVDAEKWVNTNKYDQTAYFCKHCYNWHLTSRR